MAEHRPAREVQSGPVATAVYWKYLIFWLLFFGLMYLISLYGVVAEA